ncbi:MAG: lysozyme [Sulfurimonas sp.]|uniref:lysozyme n=1 Tax=Sulfurimonas sp. TaxID=2022749 RepID=UPI002621BE4C|nr:lysozyme [Sulfurimonas sp.]MDD2651673.1 lysozyme [Sulfurimonas sp.]MDD3451484.1 lysozyme [Sulfurimonas sp.]
MKTSLKGIELITTFEGFSASPYYCPAGIATIGYGSTKYADGRPVKMSDKPVTYFEAEELLEATLGEYEDAINRYVTLPFLNQNQFDALVSFTYNVGIGNFKKSTLLKKLNASLFEDAAKEFLKWDKSKGIALAGLTKRRKTEMEMFNG